MTTTMKNALAQEIDFINSCLAYEETDKLQPLENLGDAELQISGYEDSFNEDFPEALKDPAIMILVWNYCVAEEKAAYAKQQAERRDAEIRKDHPDWLEYTGIYSADLGSLWIDPAELRHLLMFQGHYDAEHVDLILKAVTAWADRR